MARQVHMVEYRGEQMPLAEAIRRSGSPLDGGTVGGRLARGWSLLRALTLPLAKPAKRFDDLRLLVRSDGHG